MSSDKDEERLDEKIESDTKNKSPLLSQVFPMLVTHHLKDWPKNTLDEERLRIDFIEHESLRWYNIERPRNAELTWLNQNFKINPLHLEDITSHTQRPKIDDYEDYIFLVLHLPVYTKAEPHLTLCEIDIIFGSDYVITIHDGRLTCLKKLFEQCQNDPNKFQSVMSRSTGFLLYSIIDLLIDQCFPIVESLAEKIELIDEEIFKNTASKSTLYYMSALRREIIAFRRIFKPQISIVARLSRHHFNGSDDMEGYFSDLSDHISRIWDNLEDFKEIIEGLSATYDSLTSHRLNQIIKTLTIISVIILPLTLISSIYGMNVPLPFQEEPGAFIILTVVMIVTVIVMALVFRSRKWL